MKYEYKTIIYKEGLISSILLGDAKVNPDVCRKHSMNMASGWRVVTMERETRRALLIFTREAFLIVWKDRLAKFQIPVTQCNNLNIVRGDLIRGGAKTPALLRYLRASIKHTSPMSERCLDQVHGQLQWHAPNSDTNAPSLLRNPIYNPHGKMILRQREQHSIGARPHPLQHCMMMCHDHYPDLCNLLWGLIHLILYPIWRMSCVTPSQLRHPRYGFLL